MGSVANAFRWPKQDSLAHLAKVWGYQPDPLNFFAVAAKWDLGKQEGGGRKCLMDRASRSRARLGREAACVAFSAGS